MKYLKKLISSFLSLFKCKKSNAVEENCSDCTNEQCCTKNYYETEVTVDSNEIKVVDAEEVTNVNTSTFTTEDVVLEKKEVAKKTTPKKKPSNNTQSNVTETSESKPKKRPYKKKKPKKDE